MNDNQDDVLELAIEYAVRGQYGLTKDRKRCAYSCVDVPTAAYHTATKWILYKVHLK